jgi:hypothetical protein
MVAAAQPLPLSNAVAGRQRLANGPAGVRRTFAVAASWRANETCGDNSRRRAVAEGALAPALQ